MVEREQRRQNTPELELRKLLKETSKKTKSLILKLFKAHQDNIGTRELYGTHRGESHEIEILEKKCLYIESGRHQSLILFKDGLFLLSHVEPLTSVDILPSFVDREEVALIEYLRFADMVVDTITGTEPNEEYLVNLR